MTSLYGSTAPLAEQRSALTTGEVPVAVYGLGKMGLPLAGVFAELTGAVVGVDVDQDVVAAVQAGRAPVTGEPGLEALVADQVAADRLAATTDGVAAAQAASIHVVIVPTLLADGEPDLSRLEAVIGTISEGLSAGDLVVLESTVPPGTCATVVRPTLAERSGCDPELFGVAHCPERTASGQALRDIRGSYPKVVGGVDPESARAAALVYDLLTANAVHVVRDATTAEAVKVFEGVYRDVNIALANELARFDGPVPFSSREAIAAANRLPMCHIHEPGPGVGGHCIPVYPHFLLSWGDRSMPLVRTGRRVNEAMPAETVALLEQTLAETGTDLEGARVCVLGLTYRAGVSEIRHSPGIAVVESLAAAGADPVAVDPLVDPADPPVSLVSIDALPAQELDAAIVVTAHEAFDDIDWESLPAMPIIDGRDALDLPGTHHRVVTLGGSDNGGPRVVDDGFLAPSRPPRAGRGE